MQPKSHEDANQRHNPPQPGMGTPRHVAHTPKQYPDQEDQWAVLRHEMEGEEQREEQARGSRQADLDQRDTEEDAAASQAPFDYYDQAPNHVDIVVAGIGGAGMNAIDRMIHTRVRGVRFV